MMAPKGPGTEVRVSAVDFWQAVQARVTPRYAPGRLKLWLNALRTTFAEAETLYWAVRPLRSIEEVGACLTAHGINQTPDVEGETVR